MTKADEISKFNYIVTCRNTPISRPTLEKNPMPGHLFEGKPVGEGTTRRGTVTVVHHPETCSPGMCRPGLRVEHGQEETDSKLQ